MKKKMEKILIFSLVFLLFLSGGLGAYYSLLWNFCYITINSEESCYLSCCSCSPREIYWGENIMTNSLCPVNLDPCKICSYISNRPNFIISIILLSLSVLTTFCLFILLIVMVKNHLSTF